jgi:MFS family permease
VKARIPPQLPPGTRAERVAFVREWMAQAQRAKPSVRFSRRRRRVLVAALYLLVAAALVALPGASDAVPSPRPQVFGVILIALLLIGVYLGVFASVGNFAVRGAVLDERERAQRDRATAIAYRVLGVMIVVATFYAILANTHRLGLPIPTDAGELVAFMIPLYFAVLSLPAAVLAWTLPDPDPEPEAEPG